MNILLIQPALASDRKFGHHPLQTLFRPAPITLPTIAAITPPGHDVRIIDDAFQDIPYDGDVDLVGITGSTPFAPRMAEIARGFRERRVPVAAGGVYTTLCPDAAARFADTVVVGDAEDTWPQLIADLEQGALKPRYRSARPPLLGRPRPRRELIDRRKYILPTSFQFTRGCVHECGFCTINLQYGRQVRTTPVDAVVEDVLASYRPWFRPLIIWDDNLYNDKAYAKALFSALQGCKVRWIGQSTMLMARDEELVRLAGESGCMGLFCGIESFVQPSLRETSKEFNQVDDYKDLVRRFHDHGISVQAGIVFGFDHDDPTVFERTVEAAIEMKIDSIAFSILTPYPGTPFYQRLREEGRILTDDLSRYDSDNVVFRPAQMTPEELLDGWRWAQHQFYSARSIARRIPFSGGSLLGKLTTNLQYFWFTRARFPRGRNPARSQPVAA